LPNRCAIRRISASGDILNPHGDDITVTTLAVDCEIEPPGSGPALFALTAMWTAIARTPTS
jgi:hypothetical protein